MSIPERIYDALKNVLRMNERITELSATVVGQQQKIENLAERVIRLEAMIELGVRRPPRPSDGNQFPDSRPPE